MGRVKSLSNSGSFVLRKDNQNAKGEYQVYIQYSLDRKIAKDKTDVWVKEKEWNDKAQKVRATHPQSVRLNKILDKKKNDIDALILDFPSEKRLAIDVLRSMVKGEYNADEEKNQDFVQLAISNIETLYKTEKIGISVRDNGLNGLELFRTFLLEELGEDSISIADMTEDIVDSYIIWRKNKRNNINATINKALTPLMKAAKLAARKGLMEASVADAISEKYLPIKTKLSDEDAEDEDVHYLTKEQLSKFVALYNVVKYPRTREYMDMFLFAFHACGLRFSDILTLQWMHVDLEKHKLKKVLYKGQVPHEITLNDAAVKILEQWKMKKRSNRFVFALLPDDFNLADEEELKRMRINKNTPIKVSLKALGHKIGDLSFNLTMHVARHTFAVFALNNGVDVHKVSRLLAHSSVMVTEKVYAKFLPETLQKEVETKLNFDFTPDYNITAD